MDKEDYYVKNARRILPRIQPSKINQVSIPDSDGEDEFSDNKPAICKYSKFPGDAQGSTRAEDSNNKKTVPKDKSKVLSMPRPSKSLVGKSNETFMEAATKDLRERSSVNKGKKSHDIFVKLIDNGPSPLQTNSKKRTISISFRSKPKQGNQKEDDKPNNMFSDEALFVETVKPDKELKKNTIKRIFVQDLYFNPIPKVNFSSRNISQTDPNISQLNKKKIQPLAKLVEHTEKPFNIDFKAFYQPDVQTLRIESTKIMPLNDSLYKYSQALLNQDLKIIRTEKSEGSSTYQSSAQYVKSLNNEAKAKQIKEQEEVRSLNESPMKFADLSGISSVRPRKTHGEEKSPISVQEKLVNIFTPKNVAKAILTSEITKETFQAAYKFLTEPETIFKPQQNNLNTQDKMSEFFYFPKVRSEHVAFNQNSENSLYSMQKASHSGINQAQDTSLETEKKIKEEPFVPIKEGWQPEQNRFIYANSSDILYSNVITPGGNFIQTIKKRKLNKKKLLSDQSLTSEPKSLLEKKLVTQSGADDLGGWDLDLS